MKRKCLGFGIFCLFLGAAAPSFCTEAIPLLADRDMPVGIVHVWNDPVNLYVNFQLDEALAADGWCITETHVHIGETLADFPVNRAGNPLVGQFAYSDCHACLMETPPLGIHWTPNVLNNAHFTQGEDGKDGWLAYMNFFDGDLYLGGGPWTTELASVEDGCVTLTAWPYDPPEGLPPAIVENNFYTQYGPDIPFSGRNLTFSGNIGVEIPFGPDTYGTAWVKFFDQYWWMWWMQTADAALEGPFELLFGVPLQEGVPPLEQAWLQVGFATMGLEPGTGALKACDLRLDVHNDWISWMPVMAAHAKLEKVVQVGVNDLQEPVYEVMRKSAWAEGTRFTDRGNLATWFEYPVDPECLVMLQIESVNGEPMDMLLFALFKYGDYIDRGYAHLPDTGWLPGVVSEIVYDPAGASLAFTAVYPDDYTWYPAFVLNGDGSLTFIDREGDDVTSATGTWMVDCMD